MISTGTSAECVLGSVLEEFGFRVGLHGFPSKGT